MSGSKPRGLSAEQELRWLRERVAELEARNGEHQETETALRESEARQQVLLSAMPIAVYSSPIDSDATSWISEHVERITGFPAERFLCDPQFWRIRIHPEDRALVNAAFESLVEAGREISIAYRWRHADGRYRWFLERPVVMRDADGSPREIIGTWLDFTEHKEAEQALQRSQRRLQQALDALNGGIWEMELESGRMYLSAGWWHMLGYLPGELEPCRESWERLLHPQDRAAVTGALDELIAGTSSRFQSEHRLHRRDGSWVWVLARARLSRGAGRRWPGGRIAGAYLDITQRRRSEEEQRELQKLESLGVMAGGIAHQFNNLLTTVLGGASLALAGLERSSPRYEQLQRIQGAAERAAELTGQLLAYSGKGKFQLQRIDLAELVQQMDPLLRAATGDGVSLVCRLSPDTPAIEADRGQLRQLLINLVSNASEALGQGPGIVSIRMRCEHADRQRLAQTHVDDALPPGEYVRLEISDDGPGVEPSDLGRLFDPFFTTKFTGRGLGLAAVLGIVRGHHGAIRLDSEPGRGMTVTVLLPCASLAAESVAPPPAAVPAGAQGTILVVDDDADVLLLSSRMLEFAGYSVVTAADGVEGIEMLARHAEEIAAVLLDLTMPRMSGDKAFDQMRELRPDLPIILTSGYHQRELMIRFAQRGFAGFIQKPFRLQELLDAFARVLAGRRSDAGGLIDTRNG